MIKRIVLTLALGLIANGILAQNTISIKVIDKESKEAIIGASVYIRNSTVGTTTDLDGIAILNRIPKGKQIIAISFIGYETIEKVVSFPTNITKIVIELHEDEATLDTVVIASTRSKRTIAQIPTRVEVVGLEELGEKAIMNSANIAMILRESTGIQMQQTSANSANQSIRIQGLDGRFTQLLKDGFPLFGGFSSGLSIMQIPPLDLQQVEIIKGSSSTLYGGGAIAGLVNLISKRPKDKSELSLMIDKTSRKGNTFNVYYSKRSNNFGWALYSSGNIQDASDLNNDHFSDLPKVRSISFNPTLFYYPNITDEWRLSLNVSYENRIGGDIDFINDKMTPQHNFYEENSSKRLGIQLSYKKEISESKSFNLKNSVSYFNRELALPNYIFKGKQLATFTEATYSIYNEKYDWVLGSNLITESFNEEPITSLDRSYKQATLGGFVQNNWNLKENLTLEFGLRLDINNNYGIFMLPRMSLFYQLKEKLSSRLGFGFGYKIPTIFTENSELRAYKNVLSINPKNFKSETSIGFNADVNYKTSIFDDAVRMTFNQLFFFTKLKNSLILDQKGANYTFVNANTPLNSYGFESNLKFKYKDFVLFTNYAFNNVKINDRQKVLTPKHSFGGVLMYEVHDKWRIGYEAYYRSSQLRNDLTETPNFWTMGFMIMKTFRNVSIYSNFENFTDTKQSNYQSMVQPPHTNPTFTDIWGPTDGFVFNAGVLIKL